MLSVSVLSVSPTVRRSLLIPRRGFPSSSNTFRLGRRLSDAGRLTETDTKSVKSRLDSTVLKPTRLYLHLALKRVSDLDKS